MYTLQQALTPLPVGVAGQVMLEVIKIEGQLHLQDDTPKLGAPAYSACRCGPICSLGKVHELDWYLMQISLPWWRTRWQVRA